MQNAYTFFALQAYINTQWQIQTGSTDECLTAQYLPTLIHMYHYSTINSFAYSTQEDTVVVRTAAATQRASHLAIVLELDDWRRIDTNRTFEYRDNPVIDDINPRNHLIR